MFRQITLLSLLTAIFAFGTVTACKTKRHKKHHKGYKKDKKGKKGKKACKRLYDEILAKTSYTKADVKKMYGDKDGFVAACKAGRHDGPFKKLLKCKKKDESFAKCSKKHLAILFGKQVKKDKIKKVKVDKPKVDKPKADETDGKNGAFKSIDKLGETIFQIAAKGDFDAIKKLMITAEDAKDFDKGTLFKKFANEKKFKAKFDEWTKLFKGTTFKSVKAKDDEKKTVKPGEKVKKLEELTAAIKKDVTVWNVNVKAEKGGKITKCAFVAIALGDKWKLIRLKGCKVK